MSALGVASVRAVSLPLGVNQYLESLPKIARLANNLQKGAPSPAARDGDYSCSTQSVHEAKNFTAISGVPAASTLWPGAIVELEPGGELIERSFPRNPLKISTNLERTNDPSIEMRSPDLDTFRKARTELLGRAPEKGGNYGNSAWDIREIHSSKHAAFAIGGGVSLGKLSAVGGAFNWDDRSVRSRWVITFVQPYYTIDINSIADPVSTFAEGEASYDKIRASLRSSPLRVIQLAV